MATPHLVGQHPGHQPASLEKIAPVIPFPRQSDEGFLNSEPQVSELPFSTRVADWMELPDKYKRGVGLIRTAVVSVVDDRQNFDKPSVFVHREIIPENQQHEIGVEISNPLATRVNGFNTYIAIQFAKLGLYSRITGTNQTPGHGLLHDAQANLAIAAEADRRASIGNTALVRPGESVDFNYSMSKMRQPGKVALASYFDRTIHVSKGLDPCLAEKMNYREHRSLETLQYLLRDGAEIPRNLYHNARETGVVPTLRRARHWRRTIGLSASYASIALDKWQNLATGEAGTLIDAMPADSVYVMHDFINSKFNSRDIYASQLTRERFPHSRIVSEKALHLSAADAQVVYSLARNMVEIVTGVEAGASKNELAEIASQPVIPRR